jgi:hypothetical protein
MIFFYLFVRALRRAFSTQETNRVLETIERERIHLEDLANLDRRVGRPPVANRVGVSQTVRGTTSLISRSHESPERLFM